MILELPGQARAGLACPCEPKLLEPSGLQGRGLQKTLEKGRTHHTRNPRAPITAVDIHKTKASIVPTKTLFPLADTLSSLTPIGPRHLNDVPSFSTSPDAKPLYKLHLKLSP